VIFRDWGSGLIRPQIQNPASEREHLFHVSSVVRELKHPCVWVNIDVKQMLSRFLVNHVPMRNGSNILQQMRNSTPSWRTLLSKLRH